MLQSVWTIKYLTSKASTENFLQLSPLRKVKRKRIATKSLRIQDTSHGLGKYLSAFVAKWTFRSR